jgi:hypothetical protein
MTTTSHYQERIARATERLAQLQAKELLANQRRESIAKEQAKRAEARRRAHLAELVFLAGGSHSRTQNWSVCYSNTSRTVTIN